MAEVYYIDTRPGRAGPFNPPSGIEDYAHWLHQAYKRAALRDGTALVYFGAAQRIHQLIWSARHQNTELLAFGPYGAEALVVIRAIAGEDLPGAVLA